MKKILITGASGFIGQSLCKSLSKLSNSIRGTVRSLDQFLINDDIEYRSVGDIGLKTKWKDVLAGMDYVIHCAGIAHKMNNSKEPEFYHSTNVEGTKALAEQAAETGIKRLIFLSSIKVNGKSTGKVNEKMKFSHNDFPEPKDDYAISKLEAEKILFKISAISRLEVVVVRLPLVYGYGAKGNLARLIKFVKSGIPLPLSLVKNQRSMIGMDNLVDLLIRCIDHPEASGKTFLASDGEDLSTPKLIKLIGSSMERKANLFPCPIFMLKFLGSVFGRSEEINRLVGSLKIDNSYTKKTLDWTPSLSVKEGIRRMVQEK